jgi:hypothetical protein
VNVVPVSDRPLLLDFNGGGDAYVSRAEVTEGVLPSVAEIIARHQEAQAGQDALIETYVADARMEQHFRPSATDPGFDVVTDNRFYFDRDGTEWEELTFNLNGSKWGANRPPFPLLQPEKVLSLPLDLRLNKDYAYKLEGWTRSAPARLRRAVQSLDGARSLYRGRSGSTPRLPQAQGAVGADAVAPPVVSSEEIQYFTPAAEWTAGASPCSRAGRPPDHAPGGEEPARRARGQLLNFRVNARTSRPCARPRAPPTT